MGGGGGALKSLIDAQKINMKLKPEASHAKMSFSNSEVLIKSVDRPIR